MLAFIDLTINIKHHQEGLIKHIENVSEVQECDHIAGKSDYILKVYSRFRWIN